MDKVIRDGMVAVLYSPGFGAGWYTWNYDNLECLFDPEIVEMLEKEVHPDDIESFAEKKYGEDFYAGGTDDLRIMWLKQGTEFVVHEFDGSESIQVKEDMGWIQA